MNIGILGARSFIGQYLLAQLKNTNIKTIAFSRQPPIDSQLSTVSMSWYPPFKSALPHDLIISHCISCMPIWILAEFLPQIEAMGVKRLVAISSTSVVTKAQSQDHSEQRLVSFIQKSEQKIIDWASERQIEWLILRPTLIYDLNQDKNLSRILTFIKRFGFFPIYGEAHGLRQPIHAEDVATACLNSLFNQTISNQVYTIAGAEIITYRQMIQRLFQFANKKPRFISIPLWFIKFCLYFLRFHPRYHHINIEMFDRMNQDLIFDNQFSQKDFRFNPRNFGL